MPSYSAGSAEIDISPNMEGFVTELRRRLDAISADLTVEVDADTAKVKAKVDEAARDRKATIEVDADTAAAEAKIDAAARDRKATIDVDDSQIRRAHTSANQAHSALTAMSAIRFAGLASAIGALIPVLGGVAGAAAGLGGLFAGIGGTAAVGGSGIMGAFTAMKAESAAAGTEAANSAKQQRDALDSVADAHQRLADSQRNEMDALRNVTEARKTAKDAIDDLNVAVKDGELAARGAGLSYEAAVARLAETQQKVALGKATSLDVRQAQLAVDQAAQNITDVNVRNQQNQRKASDANVAGVEGSPQVRQAQERYADAQQTTIRSTRDLARAQEDLATQAARSNTAADKLADAMAKLSPNAREFVLAMQALGPQWTELRKVVQDKLFEGMGDAVTKLAHDQLPNLQTVLGGIATSMNTAFKDTFASLDTTLTSLASSGKLKEFTDAVGQSMSGIAPFMSDMVQAFTDITIKVAPAIGPFFTALGDALKNISPALGDLGGKLLDALTQLMPYLASFVKGLAEDFAPILPNLVDGLKGLMTVLGGLASVLGPLVNLMLSIPGAVPAMLGAFATIKAAGAVGGFVSDVRGGFGGGKAAGAIGAVESEAGAVGRLSGVIGSVSSLIGGPLFGLALAGAGTAATILIQKHNEAADAAQRLKDSQNALISTLQATLDPVSGLATQQTITATAKDLQERGFFDRARSFGIDPRQVVLGATTDATARQAITGQLARTIGENLGGAERVVAPAGVSKDQLAQALAGDRAAIESVDKALSDYADRTHSAKLSLDDLRDTLPVVGESASTLGREMNGNADAMAAAQGKAKDLREASEGLFTMTEQGTQKMKDLGIAVVGVPNAKTIEIDVPTTEQRKKLTDLGYAVSEEVPNQKTVTITVPTDQAHNDIQQVKTDIDNATAPRVVPVTLEMKPGSGMQIFAAPLTGQPTRPLTVPGSLGSILGPPHGDSGQGNAGNAGIKTVDSMKAAVANRFPGMSMTSAYRDEPGSYHSTGQAADFSDGDDDTPGMQALATYIADNYQSQTLELIHSPFGRNIKNGQFVGDGLGTYGATTMGQHRNHVHWAVSGPVGAPGAASPTGTFTGPGAATAGAYAPGGGGLVTYGQAPLPGRRSDSDIAVLRGKAAVDQANSARNAVYANPASTDAEKQGADLAYQEAQNSLEALTKDKFNPSLSLQGYMEAGAGNAAVGFLSTLGLQDSVLNDPKNRPNLNIPGFARQGANILGTGLLSFFGLQGSILSDTNTYNKDLNKAIDFYNPDANVPTVGYSYVPKNLPQAAPYTPAPAAPAIAVAPPPGAPPGAPPAAVISTGDPTKDAVRSVFATRGWGEGAEWEATDWIVAHESSWDPNAVNPDGGAWGLFQFLGATADQYVPDRNPDPSAQAVAGAAYIADRYGDPLAAQRFWECVPLDTRILTRRGWLRHNEVLVGDQTIGYNPKTGRSEWTSVTAVHHYDAAPVVEMGNNKFRVRSTPNHRWVAEKAIQRTHGGAAESVSVFVETKDIGSRHRLRLAAEADTGEGLPISPNEARILGWIMGDGSVVGDDVRIYQDKPKYLDELESLFKEFPHSHYVYDRDGYRFPEHTWRLRSTYARDLLARSRYRAHGPVQMVLAMSNEQREQLIEGFFGAEGWESKVYDTPVTQRRFAQAVGEKQDALVLAVYLLGHRPRVHRRHSTSPRGRDIATTIPSRPWIGGETLAKTRKEIGTEPVWCVTTELASWTADQDGQVFLTGNSNGWYDAGGVANGAGVLLKQVLKPERVLDPRMTEAFDTKLIPILENWSKPDTPMPGGGGPQYVNQFNGTNVADYRELVEIAERRAAMSSIGAMAAL